MDYEQLLCERRDDVLVLSLNRPAKLNAWTPRMMIELGHAIAKADEDPAVGALVLTGSGRGFCAGADIEAVFQAQLEGDTDAAQPGGDRDWIDLIRTTKPIVAAVNGPCIGVGLTMILPFDRIVVAESAKLALGFIKMGLVPELASSVFLPLRCGIGAASDLMISGRQILGPEAAALGLADECVPDEEVLDAALARARSYAASPTPQVRWIKQLLTQNVNDTDVIAVQRREAAALANAYATPEHKEAVAAFREKRPPVFRH